MLHPPGDMDPIHEGENIVGSRHPRRSRWMLALGVLALGALLVWLVPQNRNDREDWEGGGVKVGSANQGSPHSDMAQESKAPTAVGTAGTHSEAGSTEDAAVLREIETITGTNDASSLVGRRVDLHVDVHSRANDYAFWVGPKDNRVLVVWGRDNRDGTQRQAGLPAGHNVSPVRDGQRAAISGIVQAIPKAEERYSWDLTEQDERDLHERKIYIRADTVRPEGHGTP